MGQLDIDASNTCIPNSSPLHTLFPPLPTTPVRGEPCVIDGKCGRLNSDRPILLYGSGKLVVVRELGCDLMGDLEMETKKRTFVYRGHGAHVTCAKFSPSGCYVASGDAKGHLRVWSYDNEEHLCKLDLARAMTGPIRDIAWDMDNKRICIVGEASSPTDSSLSTRVIQWDTGVTCGELGQHIRNRSLSCTFRQSRPMRIVTGGGDDHALIINSGPPFSKTTDRQDVHVKGGVNCVRYSHDDRKVASVGGDKRVCVWDGLGLEVEWVLENVHEGSIFGCDWSRDDKLLLTCGADGKINLIDVDQASILHTWDVMDLQRKQTCDTIQSLPDDDHAKNRTNTCGFNTAHKTPFGGMQVACTFLHGDRPISIGFNGTIAILPPKDDEQFNAKFLTGHQAPIASMTVDPTTSTLYTGDTDGVICAWDANTGKCMRIRRHEVLDEIEAAEEISLMGKVHSGAITSMILDGEELISCGWDDVLRVSCQKEGDEGMVARGKIKVDSQPNALAIGKELVVVVTVAGIVLFKDGKIVSELIPLSYTALSACVSNDDTTICIGGDDHNIHIYSITTTTTTPHNTFQLTEKHTIQNGHLRPIHSLRFSPDNTLLASADSRDVCIWSFADDYSPIISKNRWCFHSQKITSLAWCSNTVLASGSLDDCIFLWSLKKKMKRVKYPFAHRGGVTGLVFLRDGRLVSSGGDGCVCLWDVGKDVEAKFG